MSEEEDFSDEVEVLPDDDEEKIDLSSELVSVCPAIATEAAPPDAQTQELIGRFNPQGPAASRLLFDLKEMMGSDPKDLGFRAAPKGSDLFTWEIQFFGFQPKSAMLNDLQTYEKHGGRSWVELEATFPPTYPMHPPFLRVVRPRFQSGSTIITDGGSICTDVLTMEAWNPQYDIQGLILNVFTAVCAYSPRIDFDSTTPYSIEEARKSYKWAAGVHSWPLPPGF
jgi:ubiquitin-conjugating enzyme E2 Q